MVATDKINTRSSTKKMKEKTKKKEMKKKRIHSDSDSEEDSSYVDDESIIDESSSYESDESDERSESEEESESEYEKKSRKKNKKKKSIISHEQIQEIIAKLIPSKYINEKIKKNKKRRHVSDDEEDSESEAYDSENSESDMEEENESDEEYYDDDDDEENEIVLLVGGGGKNEEEEYDSNDDKYDCNSDDERTFMKEKYQKIELPPQFVEKQNKRRKTKPKKKSEENKQDDKDDSVEKEYLELCELKKDLNEKLKKKPNSKVLNNMVSDCDNQIKKLVKKNRIKNAKEYHKLIHNTEKHTNEVDYFKTKMSHTEQRKVMKELKNINQYINIDKPYRLALLDANIPPKFKAIAFQKLNVLKTMEAGDPEYYKLKHWVDAFMRIPFSNYKTMDMTLSCGLEKCNDYMMNAKKTLDECVYGLDDAKMQIMQMMGQWIANPQSVGTAIAIKGPMGTGKTTLVKEGISKIMNRDFAFIALGGNSDASFLEGHSYTYEGSNWGKIVQILMESKSMNPVIYFDELDKISDTPKGEEIIGILTHLTDTTQNNEYHDKYFSDISFDLSKCLFIFSYNDESKVNPILRDRMYRIQTKGYELKEKLVIARNYLLPKIREQVNFKEEDVIIPDETIKYIVSNEALTYKEDGVRNLKRCLEIVYTKLNLFRLVKNESKLFEEQIKMEVKFPFTVEKEHVDIMIKHNDKINPSLIGLYI